MLLGNQKIIKASLVKSALRSVERLGGTQGLFWGRLVRLSIDLESVFRAHGILPECQLLKLDWVLKVFQFCL